MHNRYVSIQIALLLNRKPGSWVERLLTGLAPLSSAPSWMFGLLMIIIFYRVLGIYDYGLGVSYWVTSFDANFLVILLKGLLLPFLAIFLSKIFQSIYSWRTYFMSFSNESYLELGRAKGLPPDVLEKRYLLRPALPSILTSFALIMISIWQECIAVEYFFNVGGIGSFFVQALDNNEIGVVVALVTTFAYFLAITVLILDIVYALVDPRIKIQSESRSEKPLKLESRFNIKHLWSVIFCPGGSRDLKTNSRIFFRPHRSPERRVPSPPLSVRLKIIRQRAAGVGRAAVEFSGKLFQYRSAAVGTAIIGVLILIAIGTVIVIPYNRAISMWRGDDRVWIRNPTEVPPAWINYFRQQKLPENIQLNSQDGPTNKVVKTDSHGNPAITIQFQFDYEYDSLPQDVLVLFNPRFAAIQPFAYVTWITPDGREIPIKNTAVTTEMMERFDSDTELAYKLKGSSPVDALFTRPSGAQGEVLKGVYGLQIKAITFEKDSNIDAELIINGQVYGLAGTDGQRRDLLLMLLWGTVAALSFGILAAIITTLASVTLAAAAAWFGGWVDGLIQRISEVNMVLPILPTSILIFFLYSKNFWVILGVTVGLSIFGNSVKNYRAMFMQIKTLPYIEAASSYGASDFRIISHYLLPKVRSVLIPQLIILVPGYIFFESTLSFLGVSDPTLPTLGNQLVSSLKANLAGRPIHLLLESIVMLILIALGFALERLFNESIV